MQYLKDKGFVLRRVNFGDSDRYITIFTKDHGKIEVVAKGVRKITSRRSSSVELLNLVDFQAVRSRKNFVLTEVKLINPFDTLKQELDGIQKAFLMCEIVDQIMPVGVAHDDVFDLMNRAACKMLENDKNMAYFQAKLLSLMGFWDGKTAFENSTHVQNVVEETIERKLKTYSSFDIASSK